MIRITIVSDVVCPFCYLGYRYITMACEMMMKQNPGISYKIDWEPFFLNSNPSTIPEEGIPLAEYLSKKYGHGAGQSVNDPNSPMNRTGRQVGITFNPNRRVVKTHKAHVWMEYVKQNYSNEIANDVMELLLDAYHVQAKNISSHDVLYNMIMSTEKLKNTFKPLDRATFDNVLNDPILQKQVNEKHLHYTKERQIHGVPYFMVTRDTANHKEVCFSGAQPPEKMQQYLQQALA